ncbi:YitT family protein [Alkalihalobacillus sp. AL-G]|uniref:YitT family protein n=1 Tax=Alkalihalobacillus sp. AL-G TaxID=2926399 RepID=UPI00272C3252|nr:YitT family protein [Alkalihalobacillus sp. AL-G]WLD94026.1 YitT family protein [Alkalihalobacillus sp. AL-G]
MSLKKLFAIIIGSIFVGAGINGLLAPHHLLDGGIIGISLIANYTWGFQPGLVIILLSLPLYGLAWFYHRSYFYNSLHGLLISSFFIDVLAPIRHWSHPPLLLCALIGGFLVGTGIGIMLQQETSTGGTDLLAQMISKVTHINVGIIIFLIDAVVIVCGGIFLGSQSFLYSVVTIIVVGMTTTFITMTKTSSPTH